MTKIIQRHDTAANWTSVNPVLAAGEMGIETDTNKFKFGDGVTAWSDLAYATSGSGGGGDSYTKAETDSLLDAKQDKLTALNNLVIKKEMIGQLSLDWYDGSSVLDPIPDTLTFNSGTTYTNYPFYNQYLNDGDIIIKFSFIHNTSAYQSSSPKLKYTWANNRGYISYYIGASSQPTAYFGIDMIDSGGTSRTLLSKGCPVESNQKLNVSFVWRKDTGNWSLKIYNDSETLLNSANGTSKYDYTGGLTVENTPVLISSLGNNNGKFTVYPKTFSLSSSDVESTNIYSKNATTSTAGIVQPDGTSITVSETGVISGQDVKTFTGYSNTGTLVLKSINGVLQWVAES